MRKGFMKKLALLLAAVMVITMASPSALVAEASSMEQTATGYETTYLMDELALIGGYGFTVNAAEGTTEYAFAGQYQEVRYAVPAEVLNAGVTGFRANVTSDNGGWLSLKAQDSAATQLAVEYGNPVIMCSDASFSQFAMMNTFEGEQTIEVASITFFTANATDGSYVPEDKEDTEAPEEGGSEEPENPGTEVPAEPTPENPGADAKESVFGLADVKLHHRWDGSVATEGGVLKFPSQYYEFVADLPAEIDLAGVESVTVKFAAETENLCIKLYDTTATANGDLDATTPAFYGNSGKAEYSVVPNGGTLAAVGIMSMDADANFEATLTGIVVKYKDGYVPAPVEEKLIDVIYTKNLSFVHRWDSSKVSDASLSFSAQYEEYVFTLEEALDIEKCRSLKVSVSGQENVICIKLYDEEMNELRPYYDLNGSSEYALDLAGLSGKIAKVAVMSLASDAAAYPYGVKIEGIEAKMVAGFATPRNDKAVVVTDLSLVNRWNSSDKCKNDITFSSLYHEYVYTLSEAIPTSLIDSVVIKVKDQANQIAIKFYNDLEEEALVDYDVVGKDEYVYAPKFEDELAKISFMSMAASEEGVYPYGVTVESITINLNGAKKPAAANEEVIELTGDKLNFVNHWEEGAEPVGATFSFAKQWDEYVIEIGKGLDMERCKSISIKVKDQGNVVSYKVYSADDKELQPFYGKTGNTTINPSCDGIATKFAVMGSAEPGDGVYPYGITIESVTFVMDTTPVEEVVEKGVERELRDFSDAVTALMDDKDFIVGTAISYQEFADEMEMELVTKHFNGVTLGNELKPDSMLKANAAITQVELNGEMVDFPVLDYSNAERYLNFFVDWNEKNPEKPIRMRGHVLVWHSQTPDFFFREDYNTSKPYASAEEMLKREEIYIRSVAEHFTGANSKYKDLFYGWDVVNEAVSDGTGTYRNANENSTWWKVFNSPDFINQAFVFANKYFPASIDLYYNDYNETSDGKMAGIVKLLENVKATEGARIDGMGMQGHYQIQSNNPTIEQFEKAVKTYASVVGKVQVTELDFNQSTKEKDSRLTDRYFGIFTSAKKLREEGYNVTGITIWGVVDKHSWLQTANNVGGGSTNNNKKYPLLFDNNYKAKEAYHAIVAICPEKPVVTVKNGVYEENGKKVLYIKDEKAGKGLFEVNGEIYCTGSNGVVKTGEVYIKIGNELGLPYGNYLFDENGCKSHYTGFTYIDGVKYFYQDGFRNTFGLVEFEGDYYYISSYGKVITGDYFVNIPNGYVEKDSYLFDEDGKLSNYTGIANNYYYTNGRRIEAGLVEFDGKFYYVKKHGVLAIGDVYVKNTNGLKEFGYYWFNTDGTMSSFTGFRNISGDKYYYQNGLRTALGLIEVDGEYYYTGTRGRCLTGVVYVFESRFGITKGHHTFGEDGKFIQ